MEISLIVEIIQSFLNNTSNPQSKDVAILEFGSGDGFQIPYLQTIGKVIGSDVYASDGVKTLRDARFVTCSITNTPFVDEQFDLIFSNHVVPDLADPLGAFREIIRIGKRSCLYAFSVPTSLWLLLSLPAQYYYKARGMGKSCESDSKWVKLLSLALPEARGSYANFVDCYRSFRIKSWRQLFHDRGFRVIEEKPLLLYGPSEWPIVPTSRSHSRFCSSMLFLMNNRV